MVLASVEDGNHINTGICSWNQFNKNSKAKGTNKFKNQLFIFSERKLCYWNFDKIWASLTQLYSPIKIYVTRQGNLCQLAHFERYISKLPNRRSRQHCYSLKGWPKLDFFFFKIAASFRNALALLEIAISCERLATLITCELFWTKMFSLNVRVIKQNVIGMTHTRIRNASTERSADTHAVLKSQRKRTSCETLSNWSQRIT